MNNLVRVADLLRAFSKGETSNWSYKLFKVTEILDDTIASCRNDNLTGRYKETFLKKTELTMNQNEDVIEALNLNWIKMSLTSRAYANQLIY